MSPVTKSGVFSLRGHIRVLCSLHGIELREQEGADAVANAASDGATLMSQNITVQPITSPTRYFTALHEVGHRALRHHRTDTTPARKIIKQEWEAWEWAQRHSKIGTPPDCKEHILEKIGTYYAFYGFPLERGNTLGRVSLKPKPVLP